MIKISCKFVDFSASFIPGYTAAVIKIPCDVRFLHLTLNTNLGLVKPGALINFKVVRELEFSYEGQSLARVVCYIEDLQQF